MSCKLSSSAPTDGRAAQENKDALLAAAATSAIATGDAHKVRLLLAHCGLLLVVVAGGALLVWWALAFHHSNEQLWMVPVGLVLLGTPIFVWLSVFASAGVCGGFRLLRRGASTAPSLVSDPERR